MPDPVFPNIVAGQGSRRQKSHRTLQVSFGDGYDFRAPDGINTEIEEWTLSFTDRPKEDIQTITDFLDGLRMVDHFLWTPPDETDPKQWVQNAPYDVSFGGHETRTLSVAIKRVYRF